MGFQLKIKRLSSNGASGILQEKTKATFYHSSAITDGSETANAEEIIQLKKKLDMNF